MKAIKAHKIKRQKNGSPTPSPCLMKEQMELRSGGMICLMTRAITRATKALMPPKSTRAETVMAAPLMKTTMILKRAKITSVPLLFQQTHQRMKRNQESSPWHSSIIVEDLGLRTLSARQIRAMTRLMYKSHHPLLLLWSIAVKAQLKTKQNGFLS